MANKCEMCGICCKIFLINLSKDEFLSGRYQTVNSSYGEFKDFSEVEKYGLNFLEHKEDGSCIYLRDNGCSIHQHRPQVCREFFCSSDQPKFKIMIDEIRAKKESRIP